MKEHPYVKGVCPIFDTCKYRKGEITLADPPNRPECEVCLIAIAWSKKINKMQGEVRNWYKKEMPKVKLEKFNARRFEVKHKQLSTPIVVNRSFYEEVMSNYKNDPLYSYRLELLKKAHILIKESEFDRTENPKHHPEGTKFYVYVYNKDGLNIEFKVKKNNDGAFLYYMRLI